MRRLGLGGLTVIMGIASTGCVAWKVREVPAAQLAADPKTDVIRVTQRDSVVLFVYQPKMVGDTLTGHPSPTAIQRVSIPTKDIREVATRYHHIGKTLLAALAVAGGIGVYALLQSLNSGQP
jgi:hypothetical protein